MKIHCKEVEFYRIQQLKESENITELNIFLDDTMRFFEMHIDDEFVMFFRLRNRHCVSTVGNAYTFPKYRKQGYSKIMYYCSMKLIDDLFPKTEIFYGQTEPDNINNIMCERIWGWENRREETHEPNRFGFIDWAYEPPKGFVDFIYYDDWSRVKDRHNAKLILFNMTYELLEKK